MNRRLARFWSVIKLYETYNLTYSSTPPSESRFQIQEREEPHGNPDDWVIIRIYYPLPNSIEVRANNKVVKPKPQRSGVFEDLKDHVTECGANNFFYENGTIEFVVTGESCQVKLRLTSYIQLTARISTTIDQFYE